MFFQKSKAWRSSWVCLKLRNVYSLEHSQGKTYIISGITKMRLEVGCGGSAKKEIISELNFHALCWDLTGIVPMCKTKISFFACSWMVLGTELSLAKRISTRRTEQNVDHHPQQYGLCEEAKLFSFRVHTAINVVYDLKKIRIQGRRCPLHKYSPIAGGHVIQGLDSRHDWHITLPEMQTKIENN